VRLKLSDWWRCDPGLKTDQARTWSHVPPCLSFSSSTSSLTAHTAVETCERRLLSSFICSCLLASVFHCVKPSHVHGALLKLNGPPSSPCNYHEYRDWLWVVAGRCHIKISLPWKIRPGRNNHGIDVLPLLKYRRPHKKSFRYRIAFQKSLQPGRRIFAGKLPTGVNFSGSDPIMRHRRRRLRMTLRIQTMQQRRRR